MQRHRRTAFPENGKLPLACLLISDFPAVLIFIRCSGPVALRYISHLAIIATLALGWFTTTQSSAQSLGVNDLLWSGPGAVAPLPYSYQSPSPQPSAGNFQGGAPVTGSGGGVFGGTINLYAQAQARAAVIEDSTRVATSNNGFLPSVIPVRGQQFFGSPTQAAVAGSGSVLKLSAMNAVEGDEGAVVFDNKLVIQNLNAGSPDGTTGQSVALQSSYLQYRYLLVGVTETAFATTAQTRVGVLDTTGPNARVTALQQGTGTGQGRLSYTLFSPNVNMSLAPGLTSLVSVEAPVSEIKNGITTPTATGKNTSTFSRYPDFITTTYFSDGHMQGTNYVETFHLQSSTLFRNLGLQNDNESIATSAFGWGESLSAVYLTSLASHGSNPDAFTASVTGGQGIAHYIVDLQTASTSLKSNGNDAYLNFTNRLVPLPVLAWFVSYKHNWSDFWASSFTYSCVELGSFAQPSTSLTSPGVSPYRQGQYVGANLLFTKQFRLQTDPAGVHHSWQMGFEYLYGQKKTLDGSLGHDDRGLFLMAIQW